MPASHALIVGVTVFRPGGRSDHDRGPFLLECPVHDAEELRHVPGSNSLEPRGVSGDSAVNGPRINYLYHFAGDESVKRILE